VRGCGGVNGGRSAPIPEKRAKGHGRKGKEKPTRGGQASPKKTAKNPQEKVKNSGGGSFFFLLFFWWAASYIGILSKQSIYLIFFCTFVYAVGHRNTQ